MMENTMRTLALALVWLSGSGLSVWAEDKIDQRLMDSAIVIEEILNMPDSIPQDLLDKAECVAVLPSVKKFALGIGGSYGRGVMTCRGGDDFEGSWGAPAMVGLEGGSIGFQLGGQSTDFVLLIMNSSGAKSILRSKVKLGADATAAAGPKGRSAGASTDAYMTAEILTYSRAKGLFAGISLEGSTLRPDNDANETLYGKDVSAKRIILEGMEVPESAERLITTLQKASPKNKSE